MSTDVTTTAPSIEAQIDCVKREIAMRESAYPGWVTRKRMSQTRADREIATMRAVLDTLYVVRSNERSMP